LEKRRVTLLIGGMPCSFYSDDTNEYLANLEQRANAVVRQTARFSGSSAQMNALLSVLSLTDELLRAEQKIQELAADRRSAEIRVRKAAANQEEKEPGQLSVWDILKER